MTPAFRDVAAFLDDLDPARREVVDALRDTIRTGQPELREQLKWNSQTYTSGEVDLITINVQNRQRQVQLVLHRGASRPEDRSRGPLLEDDEGLVRWLSDIRGVIVFADPGSVLGNEAALRRVIRRWVALP
jgi:hypothetical protein